MVLIRGYEPFDIVRLPVPDNFFYAVAHPAIVVSTKMAREVLPREISLSSAVKQWGNVGGLVAGFALRDVALIGRSMHDAVVEPYRKGFIPDYDVLKASALDEGALALNIAGSGPSVFALASDYAVALPDCRPDEGALRRTRHRLRYLCGVGCRMREHGLSNHKNARP